MSNDVQITNRRAVNAVGFNRLVFLHGITDGQITKPPQEYTPAQARALAARLVEAADEIEGSMRQADAEVAGTRPARQITKWSDGFLFVDPTATKAEVADALLPRGEEGSSTAFPCRITKDRRRVVDQATRKRVTRDWRTAFFVLWNEGDASSNMGMKEARQILADAKSLGVDEIIVFGRTGTYSGPSISFRQFGVRDLASIPDVGSTPPLAAA